ncbi:MAG: sigma-70 family RNA polymerase sigma factor [Bdellovibrionota bacterium]
MSSVKKKSKKKVSAKSSKPKARRSAGNAASKAKKTKVVSLSKARKQKELTKLDRDMMILEFREKARKLGRSILRKWHARLDLQEVDSVVDLSLCEAALRYDPTKGASFITFLFYHLRGNLIRTISTAAAHSAVPAGFQEWEEGYTSEDSAYRSANAIEIADALTGNEVERPDEIYFSKQLNNLREEACLRLDPLEQEVIERIYIKGEQLLEIAKSLGYSRCHISRVKKKALEVLEKDLNSSLEWDGTQVACSKERHEEISSGVDRKEIHRRKPRSNSKKVQADLREAA